MTVARKYSLVVKLHALYPLLSNCSFTTKCAIKFVCICLCVISGLEAQTSKAITQEKKTKNVEGMRQTEINAKR